MNVVRRVEKEMVEKYKQNYEEKAKKSIREQSLPSESSTGGLLAGAEKSEADIQLVRAA